jgi:hypothetical protein
MLVAAASNNVLRNGYEKVRARACNLGACQMLLLLLLLSDCLARLSLNRGPVIACVFGGWRRKHTLAAAACADCSSSSSSSSSSIMHSCALAQAAAATLQHS